MSPQDILTNCILKSIKYKKYIIWRSIWRIAASKGRKLYVPSKSTHSHCFTSPAYTLSSTSSILSSNRHGGVSNIYLRLRASVSVRKYGTFIDECVKYWNIETANQSFYYLRHLKELYLITSDTVTLI